MGKNKWIAVGLAFYGGVFGLHHFYLGETRSGIKHLLLSWSMIPALFGLFDAINYLTMPAKKWKEKYGDKNE